jgi:hypothetical protein
MQELTLQLASDQPDDAEAEALSRVQVKYPTAAIAVFSIPWQLARAKPWPGSADPLRHQQRLRCWAPQPGLTWQPKIRHAVWANTWADQAETSILSLHPTFEEAPVSRTGAALPYAWFL